MKAIYGILLVGVSALALGGCTTDEKGAAAAFANALLGSGAYDGETHSATTVSDAADDTRTSATIAPGEEENTVSVTVAGGGTVEGPTTYAFDGDGDTGVGVNGGFGDDDATFGVFKGTGDAEDNSILVAADIDDGDTYISYAGFVGSFGDGTGNIAAAYGGATASGTKPTAPVRYVGAAAGVLQQEGETPLFVAGTATIDADFTNADVEGDFSFTDDDKGEDLGENSVAIGFTGSMSGSNYESTDVTYNGDEASGQVIGGFFGEDWVATAGVIDVQQIGEGATPKLTGAFVAENLP